MALFAPRPKSRVWVISQIAIMIVVFILLQKLLGAFARVDHTYGNVRWYFDVGALMHEKGFFNLWTSYPPVFPGLLYVLSAFQKEVVGFINFWKILNVVFVLGITYMVFRILAVEDRQRALVAAFGYALINATYNSRVTIGLFMDQFDYIPTLLVLISLYFLLVRKDAVSSIFCGIGAMTKMFPGVMLLIALFMLEKRQKVIYIAVFAITCLVILLPYFTNGMEPLVSLYNYTASRDAWETVWHYPNVKFPPPTQTEPLFSPFRSDARPYSWLGWLTGVSMLGYMVWRKRVRANASVAQQALCLLLIILIVSKGVSSYFMFWIFPLIFICYRPLLAFILGAVFMLVGNIEFFVDTHWMSIWMRHALFVGLMVQQIIAQRGLSGRRESPATNSGSSQ
jgi:hypothetical protein